HFGGNLPEKYGVRQRTIDRVGCCGTIGGVWRLVIALFVVVGLAVPLGGSAEAQVWKLKKGKTTTTAKTTKKSKSTRTARPTVRKKRATNKPRKVQLVPDDSDSDDTADMPADRERDE